MGFQAGSVSFTRFRVTEEPPQSLWAEIPNRLKRHAFTEIENLPEERGFGWVNIDDMLDSVWAVSPPEKGEFLTFSLRLDTRRVSPAVFKKHFRIAVKEEEAQLVQQGRKFVSKERKKELKELVASRLMARSLPIPAVFDVLWDTRSHEVWLASSSSKVVELFAEMFTDTFELHIEAMTPYVLALHLLGEEARERLDQVQPLSIV